MQFFEPDMIQDPQFQKIFDISYKAAKKKLESGEPVVMEDEDEEAILNRLMRLRRQEEYKFKNKKFIEGGSSTIREVNRDDFEGAEYLIKAQVFDKNIVAVQGAGSEKLSVREIEDKVLYND